MKLQKISPKIWAKSQKGENKKDIFETEGQQV